MPTQTPRALSFDAIAEQYASARPGYPRALFDALEEMSGRALSGAAVLDAGAGTGISTRLLRERGARVTALERGPGMAARLRADQPAVPLVQSDGNALPFADGSFDFVTYAQAFHWTDPGRSVPEAMRVLRPGGALALWANQPDSRVAWVAEQDERLGAGLTRPFVCAEGAREALVPFGATVAVRDIPWSRRVTLDGHLRNVGSHSYFSTLPDRGEALLRTERVLLRERFPEGMVEEPYVCVLVAGVTAAIGG
ncbi:class I SAM-dependent methyltransferase [Streptomyces boncukensis]|uniref:Class I SAM-dependent methyltransferase n=1 Tax=Streptomyces boncukensis TaxID=2711219 RepID=A0A6G4X6U9_9ACTN|nr:class I SAM-dependent methyltransferase [Streptomyces boncukensis]NGO72580.1 class I SAM-dependent methyltransferase [Streptomyces boncukensis]